MNTLFEEATVKPTYINTILLLERLHRRFLDVIKAELDRQRIQDLNNVQTLILYNIGEEELTVGELTNRGYYLGSNVSYNVKKLVEFDYLIQERAMHDKRSVKVKLSEKGKDICRQVDDLYQRHIKAMEEKDVGLKRLLQANNELEELERFWTEDMASAFRKVY
jgi:DNA-binding MarR family transcriptional regulator